MDDLVKLMVGVLLFVTVDVNVGVGVCEDEFDTVGVFVGLGVLVRKVGVNQLSKSTEDLVGVLEFVTVGVEV